MIITEFRNYTHRKVINAFNHCSEANASEQVLK